MLKAITLHQPWASLVAMGIKPEETRGRRISHRGELAIHAGMFMDMEAFEGFRGVLTGPTLPKSCIVAVVDLYDCKPVEELKSNRYGNFSPGRFGWLLRNVIKLDEPITCRGYQTIWTVPPDIEVKIRNALASQQPSGPTGG